MDYLTEVLIRNELYPGERLVWAGRPKQGILFRESDVFMIPFSLLWGGFAIFGVIVVMYDPSLLCKGSDPLPVFGIPFILAGLYMIFGRFIVDSKSREKTYYVLTDQRVLILYRLFGKRVKSLNLRTLSDISLTEKADGTGSILFGQESPWTSQFAGCMFPGMGAEQIPRFEMIENAKEVYTKIREEVNIIHPLSTIP